MNNIGKNMFDIGYMDMLAEGDSFLHRLNPGAKLITTMAFIITVVSFDKYSVSALTPFFVYPLVLIAVGGLPAGYLLKKILFVSPFAVFIGIFNPLIDREVIFHLGSIGISGGWISFMSVIMRFALTVSSALILVALTGFNTVCESLLKFGVPKPFIVQLMFFNRYMLIFTDEAGRVVRARSLRSFSKGAAGLGIFASLAGHLLLRTIDRAERIYRAMCCRGFDGRIHIIRKTKTGYREIVFVFGWIILFVLMRYYNLSLKLGGLVTGMSR
ncbi:MAG: cobalt ECF transporter T component CbiQ [Elusimicrobia bacterium]|nr:cobalt ECF transporter T component CbiQ [Elusimicrobiota bacterium]